MARPTPTKNTTQITYVKIFYKLLQCLHHISVMQNQKSGTYTKAFRTKVHHLNDFIRPANSDSKIRNAVNAINNDWVFHMTKTLISHYSASIDTLLHKIRSLNLSKHIMQEITELALTRAKRFHGNKLGSATIREFRNLMFKVSANPHVNQRPQPPHTAIPKTNDMPRSQSNQKLPVNTQIHRRTPNNSFPSQQCPRRVGGCLDPLNNMYLFDFQYEGKLYKSVEHCYQEHKALTLGYNGLAKRIRLQPTGLEASNLARHLNLPQSWHSYSVRFMFSLLKCKWYQSSCFRSTLSALTGIEILFHHSDPYWGTGRHGDGDNWFGNLLQKLGKDFKNRKIPTHHKKTHIPPKYTAEPIKTTNRFESLSIPDTTANSIPSIPSPIDSRPKPLPTIPSPPSTPSLPSNTPVPPTPSQDCTPPRNNPPWSISPTCKSVLSDADYPVLASSQPTKPTSKIPMIHIPSSQPTPTNHSPAQKSRTQFRTLLHLSPISSVPTVLSKKRPHSPVSGDCNTSPSVSSPPSKRKNTVPPKQSSSFIIKPTSHKFILKSSWKWPKCDKSILVIGASNLNRIDKSPSNDVEIHSFPGARFQHFTNMLKKIDKNETQILPETIILQIGLNDRTSIAETTAIRNLKTMIGHLSKKFPKTVIYPVQINFSNNLSYTERANLDKINKAITDLSNMRAIPKLHVTKFHVDKHDQTNIHWSTETANNFLAHWLSHVNSLN